MPETRVATCPICKKPAVHETRPFCSRRCRDIDFARWLGGGYAIPGGGADADEDGDGAGLPEQGNPTG